MDNLQEEGHGKEGVVKGLLDSIPSIRYEDGNFMIREGKRSKVINFLKKNNVSYRMWKVIPEQDELEKLRLI